MEKRQKQLVGFTRRHKKSGCSSPPIGTFSFLESLYCSDGYNSNGGVEGEGGFGNAALKWKKGKNRASAGSDGEDDDTFLSSLATTKSNRQISRRRVRTLGKIAEDCDAVPAPVPRKLRSAINRNAGQETSTSSPNSKKTPYLPISRVSFTKEEEEVAKALLVLAQTPTHCAPTTPEAITEDRSNRNVASTSYSEAPLRDDSRKLLSPPAAIEMVLDHPVERYGSVQQVKPLSNGTYQPCNSLDPPLSEDGARKDISLGIPASLPNSYGLASKDCTGNSALEQTEMQADANSINPAQKPEAPLWLVRPNGYEIDVNDEKIVQKTSEKEMPPLVQTPFPYTSHGYSTTSSSNKFAASANTAGGSYDKLSPISVGAMKTWKKCATHVYVSHMIQMHLNKEKASTPTKQAKPEESSGICISEALDSYTFKQRSIQEASTRTMQWDSSGSTNAQQRMLHDNFLNPAAGRAIESSRNGLQSGSQHVQYLHPQVPQYMCSSYYPLRPSLTGGSAAMLPQRQMWQYHAPQYRTATDSAMATMWPDSRFQDLASLHPIMSVLPSAMPPRLELVCGPYQSVGRQPWQLRLI